MAERPIDVAKLKAGFRAAAVRRGINPDTGSTVFQAANVQADLNKQAHWNRVREVGRWWIHPHVWAITPSQERAARPPSLGNILGWDDQDRPEQGDLGYTPPHIKGWFIRDLEDTVFKRIFWQAFRITGEPVDLDIVPITAVVPLIREVLHEFAAARATLKEIHRRQGFELQWTITRHNSIRMIRVAVPKTA